MDTKQLELFDLLVRTGSLSRAAAELGTSQPRLTQQLQQLERELGVTLFHRSVRGLALSEAGSEFLPFAKEMRSTFERARSAISRVNKSAGARLRLGMSFTTSTSMASEFLLEFRKRRPQVQIALTVTAPRELVQGLENGDFDLCGGLELPETTTLVRKQIFATRMVGISAASMHFPSKITLVEFCRRPLLLTSRRCATRVRLDRAFRRVGLKPTISMELDDIGTISSVVKTGVAVAILPETLASGSRSLVVRRIIDLDVPVTGYFLHRRDVGEEAQTFMTTTLERIAPRLH